MRIGKLSLLAAGMLLLVSPLRSETDISVRAAVAEKQASYELLLHHQRPSGSIELISEEQGRIAVGSVLLRPLPGLSVGRLISRGLVSRLRYDYTPGDLSSSFTASLGEGASYLYNRSMPADELYDEGSVLLSFQRLPWLENLYYGAGEKGVFLSGERGGIRLESAAVMEDEEARRLLGGVRLAASSEGFRISVLSACALSETEPASGFGEAAVTADLGSVQLAMARKVIGGDFSGPTGLHTSRSVGGNLFLSDRSALHLVYRELVYVSAARTEAGRLERELYSALSFSFEAAEGELASRVREAEQENTRILRTAAYSCEFSVSVSDVEVKHAAELIWKQEQWSAEQEVTLAFLSDGGRLHITARQEESSEPPELALGFEAELSERLHIEFSSDIEESTLEFTVGAL